MGSFSDPKDLEGLAHFLGMSIDSWFSQCCVHRTCVLMDFFFMARNFWIHYQHKEL